MTSNTNLSSSNLPYVYPMTKSSEISLIFPAWGFTPAIIRFVNQIGEMSKEQALAVSDNFGSTDINRRFTALMILDDCYMSQNRIRSYLWCELSGELATMAARRRCHDLVLPDDSGLLLAVEFAAKTIFAAEKKHLITRFTRRDYDLLTGPVSPIFPDIKDLK